MTSRPASAPSARKAPAAAAPAPGAPEVRALPVQLRGKLAILADAAKYDASCASSAAQRRDSSNGRGVGSSGGTGICHSYAPDGRCISLLKVLLTNFCTYDCLYCVNRASSNVPRARFSVDEVVNLTLEFYKRNYIEGLFLSSGIVRSPDYTMEQIVEVARRLREVHDFRGYIHLKTIPEADAELLERAGRYADRLSINIELARATSLQHLAPQKDAAGIRRSMGAIRARHDQSRAEADERAKSAASSTSKGKPAKPRFSYAGQSTQMIVGADPAPDAELLRTSASLYDDYRLKRVYYSAFSPIPDASAELPVVPVDAVREHRLYQADWLMRFYGFDVDEIVAGGEDGMLDPRLDPKLAWALKHRDRFPVNLQSAEREELLRVPGLGTRGVDRLIEARRHGPVRLADVARLVGSVSRMRPFVTTVDHSPGRLLDNAGLRDQLLQKGAQRDLFAPA